MSKKQEARVAEALDYAAQLLSDATADVLEEFVETENDDLAPLVNWLTDEITPLVERAAEIVSGTESSHLLDFGVIEYVAHARRELAVLSVPRPLERTALVEKLSLALSLLDITLATWGFCETRSPVHEEAA